MARRDAVFQHPAKNRSFIPKHISDWGWPEYEIPTYIKSHVHTDHIDPEKNEFVLLPTYRLPTLIHSRSSNAKWLTEISNQNPVWIHTSDGQRIGVQTGELVRVTTEIGYFVDRVWVTESIKPGIVACSHHMGRWRRSQDPEANRWATNTVQVSRTEDGVWTMRRQGTIQSYKSDDADSSRIFWKDGGVHQNLTFPVHPDPISGMHCWHQKVTVMVAKLTIGMVTFRSTQKINGSLSTMVEKNSTCSWTPWTPTTLVDESTTPAG